MCIRYASSTSYSSSPSVVWMAWLSSYYLSFNLKLNKSQKELFGLGLRVLSCRASLWIPCVFINQWLAQCIGEVSWVKFVWKDTFKCVKFVTNLWDGIWRRKTCLWWAGENSHAWGACPKYLLLWTLLLQLMICFHYNYLLM